MSIKVIYKLRVEDEETAKTAFHYFKQIISDLYEVVSSGNTSIVFKYKSGIVTSSVKVRLSGTEIKVEYDKFYIKKSKIEEEMNRIYSLALVMMAMKRLGYTSVSVKRGRNGVVLIGKSNRRPRKISHIQVNGNGMYIGVDYKFYPGSTCIDENRRLYEQLRVLGVDAREVSAMPKTVDASAIVEEERVNAV